MRKTLFTRAMLLAGVAMAAGAAPAYAQDSAAGAGEGDDIIVTARRSEERLQDVPISITVLSEEAIAKRNIYNANDLASYVPSLSLNSNFGPEKASFAIRGFVQEGKTAPSVGVYFADVVAPRANGGTTSGNGAGVGSMMDLQNVQVLKGPQGTLFGRNTTGGAILLVPAKPTDKLEGYVEASVGDYNLRRDQAVLNVPLADTFKVRIAVDRNKRDGYLHNRSGIGPDRLGNTNYIAARLSVVGDLTPDLENYTIFSYSRSNNNGVAPKMIGCNPNAPALTLPGTLGPLSCVQIARQNARGDGFWDVESANPNQLQRVEQWQVINTTTWTASDNLTIKNIASYAEYREKADFSLWGDNLLVPGAGGLRLPTITIGLGASGYNSAQSTFTEELQFQGTSGALDWQAGAYLEISKPLGFSSSFAHIFLDCTNALAYQCTNPLGFGSLSSTNYKDTFNNKGLYAQATYKLSDQFSVTGGIRYTMDKLTDHNRNINIYLPAPGVQVFTCQNIIQRNAGTDVNGNPIPLMVEGPQSSRCETVFQAKSKKPTWLIDLDYKPNDDMLLYAKWARGYRQGGVNPNNLGIETWGPEKVDTYEVGAKTSFRGGISGYLNIAAFYNNFRGQQLAVNSVVAPAYVASVPPIQAIVNAGKSRLWGIEVDASIRPFEGLKLDASYAYLNTKLQKFTPPVPPVYYSSLLPTAQVGEPLSLSPKNRITVTGTYTLPLDESIGEISFGATFTHTDANAAVSQIFSPFLYKVKASNLLNLNADWQGVLGSPIDLSFFMTNVTNEKIITFPSGSWQTFGADVGHTNMPRMFGFRAKYRFGN